MTRDGRRRRGRRRRSSSRSTSTSPTRCSRAGAAASEEVGELVALIARRAGVSRERARAFLRREAPHTEALLRALPFSGVADERNAPDALPRDDAEHHVRRPAGPARARVPAPVPDARGAAERHGRLVRRARHRGHDALGRGQAGQDRCRPARVPARRPRRRRSPRSRSASSRSRARAGSATSRCCCSRRRGLIRFGLLHARWARDHPSGRIAWGSSSSIGVLIVLVGALGYFPRLNGAKTTIDEVRAGVRAPARRRPARGQRFPRAARCASAIRS